jgi:thioredoxin reductase (NADPH)
LGIKFEPQSLVFGNMENKIFDVIIVGSGPAALTAAIYTTRGALLTLILGGEKWGGQLMLTTTVDNFPGFPEGISGPDLMLAMRKQAERFGAVFLEKNAESVKIISPAAAGGPAFELTSGGEKYLARAMIAATGAQTVWLDVPGVKDFIGRGVSSCAPCDAPFFREKVVAVVGGGDSAMEEASVLTKYARQVYIIHRRGEFRASKAMQEKILANSKIKVLWNTEVQEVAGQPASHANQQGVAGGEKVSSLKLKNNQTGEITDFPVDGLFVAIGHNPDSKIFTGLVGMDEKGFIKNNYEKYHSATNVPGIFVAGDVMDKQYKQAVTSAGMGCTAGMDAIKYLEELKT